RGGAGLPPPFFSDDRPDFGDAAVVCDFRIGVLRPADRLGPVRPLWGSHWPQGHLGSGSADHGNFDRGRRIATDLCVDRYSRTRAPGAVPPRAGSRARRRVGRRGSAGDRERATREESVVWDVPAARRADRLSVLLRDIPALDEQPDRYAAPGLGLACAVSRQRAARVRGPVCAAAPDRDAGLPTGDRKERASSRADVGGGPQPLTDSHPGHLRRDRDLRAVLLDDRVLAELGDDGPEVSTQP